MPAERIRFMASGNQQTGQQVYLRDIDTDIQSVAIIIDRVNIRGAANGIALTWMAELSIDGGPFTLAMQGTVTDGDSVDENGQTRTGQAWTSSLPGVGLPRQTRITVDVVKRTRTWGEIETFTDPQGIPADTFR